MSNKDYVDQEIARRTALGTWAPPISQTFHQVPPPVPQPAKSKKRANVLAGLAALLVLAGITANHKAPTCARRHRIRSASASQLERTASQSGIGRHELRTPTGVWSRAVDDTSVRRGRGFRCADSGDEVAGRSDEHGEPHTECHYGVGAPVVTEEGQADEIDHR
jgi:hypothetical protein